MADDRAPSQRWVHSPFDLVSHLLVPDEEQPRDVLKAKCGELVPTRAFVSPIPISRKCVKCDIHSIGNERGPGWFTRPK